MKVTGTPTVTPDPTYKWEFLSDSAIKAGEAGLSSLYEGSSLDSNGITQSPIAYDTCWAADDILESYARKYEEQIREYEKELVRGLGLFGLVGLTEQDMLEDTDFYLNTGICFECDKNYGGAGGLPGGGYDKSASCCSDSYRKEHSPCTIGQGDCDRDDECAGDLICGTDNCISDFGWQTDRPGKWEYHDCCTNPPYVIKDKSSGSCLTKYTARASVEARRCDHPPSSNQIWSLSVDGVLGYDRNGFTVHPKKIPDRYLAAFSGNNVGVLDVPAAQEKWIFTKLADDEYTIQHKDTGLYLATETSNRVKLEAAPQRWLVIPEKKYTQE